MGVGCPRGRLRHRRGRGALTSHGFPPPDLCAMSTRLVARGCSVRRWAAARPRDRHTRAPLGVIDLEARPGPATAHRHRSHLQRTGLVPPSSRAASTTSPCRHHRRRSNFHPSRPRAALQSGGSYYLALPPPTGTAATPPMPQPHQPRRQIPHRMRTTPSGLDNSRINKPSTTCAQPQDLTKARQRGDVETNNTTARPQQSTAETGDTSAPGKCTKNNHFSLAKAMAVSTPHRHTRAKATGVSDNRAASLTGTGSATHSH